MLDNEINVDDDASVGGELDLSEVGKQRASKGKIISGIPLGLVHLDSTQVCVQGEITKNTPISSSGMISPFSYGS